MGAPVAVIKATEKRNWPSTYFSMDEFRCKHCGGLPKLNSWVREFLDFLDDFREMSSNPIVLSSGFRCSEHPIEKKKSHAYGAHVTGCAADIAIGSSSELFRLQACCYYLAHKKMVGEKMGLGVGWRKSHKKRIALLHVDLAGSFRLRLRPRIWTY